MLLHTTPEPTNTEKETDQTDKIPDGPPIEATPNDARDFFNNLTI